MSHQLGVLRRRIEALVASGGEFRLGARMEERSVPAADLRFDDRPSAEHAVRLDYPVLSTAVRVEGACNDRRRSVSDALRSL